MSERFFEAKISIYSQFDPTTVELEDLARAATDGSAICTSLEAIPVTREQLPSGADEFFFEGEPEVEYCAAHATVCPYRKALEELREMTRPMPPFNPVRVAIRDALD